MFCQISFSQSTLNWHWKDLANDSVHGISLRQAYKVLATLPNKPTEVIVAVMDGGIDTNHLDLKKILWTNKKEIFNNRIDDDKNGYIDDINGWNFLGGKDGRNIDKASDEKSRIYHRYKSLYEGQIIDTNSLNKIQKKQFQTWTKTAQEIEFSETDAGSLTYIKMANNAIKKLGATIIKEINDSNFTSEQLEPFQPLGRTTLEAKMAYLRTIVILGVDKETPFKEVTQELDEYISGKEKAAISKIQAPSPIREDIIKDNYYNFSDKYYGNNDITGPNAKHGTHVAGLVASIPDSNWLVQAYYPSLKIMGLRLVPDGDEYDKDVALGIRYAVDNGAKIINMSFGKSYSPEQAWVDSAIRYAAQKDVLIIHSAGNEFYDLNEKEVYPNPYSSIFNDTAKNIITIGASSDPIISGSLLTDFSNYGAKIVDVLAPGDKIYSTLPGLNNHGYLRGTSMASPIVSHIAAMIRSYFPNLTAIQVKEILLLSAWKPIDPNMAYDVPQQEDSKTLNEMSKIGGIVNAANAIELAKKYSTVNTIKIKKRTN
ncbi:MAG: S8 family serine peptidase [Sediminibacterium sp.]